MSGRNIHISSSKITATSTTASFYLIRIPTLSSMPDKDIANLVNIRRNCPSSCSCP
nr:MAG TPA: hypothetical protein [Caudoviricetes sp.]